MVIFSQLTVLTRARFVQEFDDGHKAKICLDMDLVKVARDPEPADDVGVSARATEIGTVRSPIRDIKILEEKHRWLQRRRSLNRSQNSENPDPEPEKCNGYTPPSSQQTFSKGQIQPPRFLQSTGKRERIKLPLRTQSGPRLLPDKEVGKARAALVTHDLDGRQSEGDLVQVRIAHMSESASWTDVHPSQISRPLRKGRLLEGQFSKSWAGAAGPTEDASESRKVS